ncbi:Uma2 family endonuclease [Streptomyces sp. AA0539]|uniref:Uma2 family endonuclease n=1 Tax=Streptomyces sp. AA0539 TaxID=1210045 RepID=UPI00035D3B69|nr:Uma2 family endonuclease [Streptomyces sp. AA0539]
MSVPAVEPPYIRGETWDELLRTWEALDVPEGWKAEIIEGYIIVRPAPSKPHTYIASKLHRRLLPVLPEGWDVYQNVDVRIPLRSGVFQPDLVVLPEALMLDGTPETQAGDAALVVEVTSRGNAGRDRVEKLAGYARAGVPLYLLVDRVASQGPVITLFGEPRSGVYRTLWTGKFGDPIPLPDPFDHAIDSRDFPAG